MQDNDLIPRDAAKKIVSLMICAPTIKIVAEHEIDDLPAVDAAPVRHGRWIDHKDEHKCSECGEYVYMDAYPWANLRYDYCPHCRADMKDGDPHA